MMLETVAWICLVAALIPALMFFLNLQAYRKPHLIDAPVKVGISVLIPARNEEKNIERTLRAVLANDYPCFEVIILDDHSTDRTAALVTELARHDKRVRIEAAPSLPPGWCGKQHACHLLGRLARYPLLMFIDADVRLEKDALLSSMAFMNSSRAALASGIPRQEVKSFGEKLLIPLVHFVLLGFLSVHAMRRTRMAAMSAGCGQFFIARKEAYEKLEPHSRIRSSLHDGIMLPRVFRQHGYQTDLFDATHLASCRMYHSSRETWQGLGKNATEGLAADGTILPMTFLLFAGQVLPFLLLVMGGMLPLELFKLICSACFLAILPRFIAAKLYCQPIVSALLHPLGILALLAIQWQAFFRCKRGKPSIWKGRNYPGTVNQPV